MKWDDELPDEWDAAPEGPPPVETEHAVTMEKRSGGHDGQELREVKTGAWLASTTVAPLTDAVEVSE